MSEANQMEDDLYNLGIEYDELLQKPNKSDRDYFRLDCIEQIVWRYHGFNIATGELRQSP